MPREEKEKASEIIGTPAPPWLNSFSDVVTQVIVFFVMMFSLTTLKQAEQLEKIKEKVEEKIKEENLQEQITTQIDKEKGLVISIKEKILFTIGKADLSQKAKEVLDKVTPVFLDTPNDIIIEGHTDNVPIRTKKFPSNWELSTARSTAVLHYLVEKRNLSPKRVTAAGYGEYHPVALNTTAQERAKNRRVDFVVTPLSKRLKTTSKLLMKGAVRIQEEIE